MKSIADEIFDEYGSRAEREGIASLPEPARTLIAIYTAQGIIGNGGFAYFFEMDFEGGNDYEVIIQSYQNVGLPNYAKALRSVLDLFPGSQPHIDLEKRAGFISKFISGEDEENYLPVVDEAETLFFSDTKSVYEMAEAYAEGYV